MLGSFEIKGVDRVFGGPVMTKYRGKYTNLPIMTEAGMRRELPWTQY
jgi:hypothetical protein